MKKNRGISLVEIIIGASIISVGILAINLSYNTYVNYALANSRNVEAAYITQEGLEVVAFLRDKGWDANIKNLSTTTPIYLTFSGSTWATTTSPQYVDGIFLRSVTVSDVFRDANSDITGGGGTYDPNIRKIDVTVSFPQGHATTTQTLSEYLANIVD